MKLTLIRHGITEGTLKKLYYGSTDLPLLPEGAARLEELKAMGGYPLAKRYFTSGMLRTEQTLAVLYGNVEHDSLPGLREIDFGDFEMKTYEELCSDPSYLAWITGNNEANVCPGGESGVIVTDRALAALAPVIASGEDAVVITHGGVIGGVLAKWFPGGSGRYEFTPEPGRGFTVEFKGGAPVAVTKIPRV